MKVAFYEGVRGKKARKGRRKGGKKTAQQSRLGAAAKFCAADAGNRKPRQSFNDCVSNRLKK